MILLADAVWAEAGRRLGEAGVAVRDGRIAAVGPWAELRRIANPGEEARRLPGCCLLPGLMDAHAHLELSSLAASRPRAHDFVEWLLGVVEAKRREAREAVEAAAARAVAGLARQGTTGVADIGASDVAWGPLLASGLRVRLDLELLGLDPERAPAILERLEDRWRRAEGRLPEARGPASLGVSPHAPYTLSEPLWRGLAAWNRRRRAPVACHVAESRAERTLLASGGGPFAERFYPAVGWGRLPRPRGPSPLDPLDRHGLLPGALLVHGCHLEEAELRRVAAAGASLCHCPRSNAYLGQPPAPVARWLALGIPVALGTDSLASSPSLDLWEEMAFAYLWHRATPEPLTAEALLAMATAGSAQALGWGDRCGRLAPGLAADLVAVEVAPGAASHLPERLLLDRGRVRLTLVAGRTLWDAESEPPADRRESP